MRGIGEVGSAVLFGVPLSIRHFLLFSGGLTIYALPICPLVPLSWTLLEGVSPVHLEDSLSLPPVCPSLCRGQVAILAPLPLDQFHGSVSLLKHGFWKEKKHSSFSSLDCNPENVLLKPQMELDRTGPASLSYPECHVSDNATEVCIRGFGKPECRACPLNLVD